MIQDNNGAAALLRSKLSGLETAEHSTIQSRRILISELIDSQKYSKRWEEVKSRANYYSALSGGTSEAVIPIDYTSPLFFTPPATLKLEHQSILEKIKVLIKINSKWQQHSLIAVALILISTGCYITVSGWQAQHIANIQAFNLTKQAASTSNIGSDPTVPTTTKPSPSLVSSYEVAPNLPKYLVIPKLNINARVISVGLTNTGAIATPGNIYDTAWYNESAEPGQPGAMLIDGHVSSWTAHGVFYGVKTLVPGDMIEVRRGDNDEFNYKVVKSQIYPSNKVDMTAAMTPIVSGRPGLNLITCSGDVIPGTNTFSERIIVFTTQV